MSGAVAFEAGTLAEHIAREEAPPTAAAPPAQEPAKPAEQTPPAAAPAPDAAAKKAEDDAKAAAAAEANSTKPDADLSEAARTLRKNRLDERTKRLREQNDELARELQRRQDLNRQRSESERESRPAQAPAVAPDPRDPEPTFESFVAANPNHPDPYAGFISARTRWEIRQEQRTTQATAARDQQTAQAREQGVKLAGQLETARTKYSDFDAVTEPVIQAISAGSASRDADFTSFVVASAVGGDLLYALGTDKAALQAVLSAKDTNQLFRALHAVEARITGPAAAAAAPPPVSQAPPPPASVAGGATSAAAIDTTKPGTSTADHIRIEEAEIADRRKRGFRY